MNLYQDLEARGILKQVTDPALAQTMAKGPVTVYAGFDPSSDSLHVGSLLPLLTLKRFQAAGHKVIAVVGGATGMIGDPSGKAGERSLLTSEQIARNQVGITQVISKFLDLKGANRAMIVNNAVWFKDFSFVDFLRDVGKHFTVNHMMAKESVRARLEDREHGISYTEFSYMLLQAYDFYVLNKREGCRLQIGGSDQWGNITAGIELIRRMRAAQGETGEEVYGLTHPLVTKADGTKFGKSESGNVWLDREKTSPYELYQFFIQTADADVATYLKFFSFEPVSRIAELENTLKTAPEKREAQRALATELTRMIHGEDEVRRTEKASQALFGTEIRELDAKTLLSVLAGAPSTQKPRSALDGAGWPLVDALVETGLCPSKGQARKDLAAGGIYVNNERVADAAAVITAQSLIAGKYVVLRKGKKTYHLVAIG
jgi:tyrosyl-tRNA synthetase